VLAGFSYKADCCCERLFAKQGIHFRQVCIAYQDQRKCTAAKWCSHQAQRDTSRGIYSALDSNRQSSIRKTQTTHNNNNSCRPELTSHDLFRLLAAAVLVILDGALNGHGYQLLERRVTHIR